MTRQTVGKVLMLAGGAGAAAQLADVNPVVQGGLPANQSDWIAVLLQVLVAAIGAIMNGKGAGK
jgi:hypothetical protein